MSTLSLTLDEGDLADLCDQIADECKWSDWGEVRDRVEQILKSWRPT